MRSLIRNNIVTAQGQPARSQRVRAAIAGTGVWDGLSNTLQLGFSDLAQAVNYLTSHDVQQFDAQRLMTVMVTDEFDLRDEPDSIAASRFLVDQVGRQPDPPRSYLAALDRICGAFALLLLSVGIPMLLAGEEFADIHDLDPADWRLKMSDPVDWERRSYPYHKALWERVRDLIRLRTSTAALQRDEIAFFYFIRHLTMTMVSGFLRIAGPTANHLGPPHKSYSSLTVAQVIMLTWVLNCHGRGRRILGRSALRRCEPDQLWLNVASGKARIPLLPFDVRVFTT
jgi:hypothetical protein